jgi:hypothetical protein
VTNENPDATPKKKRGRPPKGTAAMTEAERARRHRAKQRQLAEIAMAGRTGIEEIWTAWTKLSSLCRDRDIEHADPDLHAANVEMWNALFSFSRSLGLPGAKRKRDRLRLRDGF